MGCLVVSGWRVGEGLKIGVERIGQGLAIASNRIGEELKIGIERIGQGLDVIANRTGGNLRITAGLVCDTAAAEYYLQVSPQTVWLTPSNNFSDDFIVVSNVSWRVE